MDELGAGLADWVVRFGYWAIFLMIVLECAGLPLPGETTLISAAIFAGTTHQLDIVWIVAVAASAAILGDNLGFWVGRRYGMAMLRRYGPRVNLTAERLKIGQWLFHQYGGRVVFLGRFTALLRTYAALLAGALNFPPRRFFVWNACGGVVWALVFSLGGYWFGRAVTKVAGPLSVILFTAVVIGIVALWWFFKRYEATLLAKAEASLDAGEKRP
jgi:membrane protein DedA with SNARE-associated domain